MLAAADRVVAMWHDGVSDLALPAAEPPVFSALIETAEQRGGEAFRVAAPGQSGVECESGQSGESTVNDEAVDGSVRALVVAADPALRAQLRVVLEAADCQVFEAADGAGGLERAIAEIGAWVLFEAVGQLRQWIDAGHARARVSVNVSAVQFAQPRLLGVVSDALQASRLPPGSLILEITESSLMTDVEAAAAMLRALKNMGVKVAVDDFGTGYSSLSYLKRLPIDIIKIDKSFVREVGDRTEDTAIVRAIIALAKSLQLSTIAEGVESIGPVELLRVAGCDCLQGYYFGRPASAAAIYS